MPRRFASIPRQLAGYLGCSERTCYTYAEKRFFPLYRFQGRSGVFVDLDEVDAAMAKLPPSRAKAGFRRFGGAPIITLPAQPEVVEAAVDQ